MGTATTVGTIEWTRRTGGRLEPAERRRLLADLARVHLLNAAGRARLLARLHPGRHAYVPPDRLGAPSSPLADAALEVATRTLPEPLLHHSRRTFVFGRAIGELDRVEVDADLLFAAALLHDTGLVLASGRDDFTLFSAEVARGVAEEVGLSTSATETLLTAITRHHSPRVTREAGPVSYLLAAGAGVDVVGLRSWDLPGSVLEAAVRDHPRAGFPLFFARVWATEAARVPEGRAMLLRRYGAFGPAVRLAPFDD